MHPQVCDDLCAHDALSQPQREYRVEVFEQAQRPQVAEEREACYGGELGRITLLQPVIGVANTCKRRATLVEKPRAALLVATFTGGQEFGLLGSRQQHTFREIAVSTLDEDWNLPEDTRIPVCGTERVLSQLGIFPAITGDELHRNDREARATGPVSHEGGQHLVTHREDSGRWRRHPSKRNELLLLLEDTFCQSLPQVHSRRITQTMSFQVDTHTGHEAILSDEAEEHE
mmetsp:Transcript_14604/g.37200  ORF Transcript_14604/g.37200 Transcript_14604/m.37200 type:complete len:230 (+) Transcript_14604:893-1582(+)